ncbi:MAG TPA: hypothetical protein VD997_13110 [Phycisphaerales bacterium]|nr:hypothetical protein [Phycisphaerales bacterium]
MDDAIHLTRPFERMGARVRLSTFTNDPRRISVNILRDRKGQFFTVAAGDGVRLCVPQVQEDKRHLLLVCKVLGTDSVHKYLCGHDEREWFAAAVPEDRGVSDVRSAMAALMPPEVRAEAAKRGVKGRELGSRHTEAYRRQGEWFFLPREGFTVDDEFVNRNEMLSRGGGKPHFAEFGYRTGGENVYSNRDYMRGEWLSEQRYRRLMTEYPELARRNWMSARINMRVYVKGRIRHPDHATINLWCWHEVLMNTENRAAAMQHLRFID